MCRCAEASTLSLLSLLDFGLALVNPTGAPQRRSNSGLRSRSAKCNPREGEQSGYARPEPNF